MQNFPDSVIRGARQIRPGLLIRLCAVLLALVTGVPTATAAAADRLEAYLKGLKSLSSEFEQITLTADGGRMMESRGTFYLKRPGKFRWEYRSPDEQVIVADGSRVWVHDQELDQISHQSQGKALSGTPAQLLATEEPIERHFKVSPWDGGDDREWIELQPKASDTQVVKIRIGFAGDRLDTMIMEDSFGQLTRFIFSRTKRNPYLKESLFRLDRSTGGDFLQID